MKQSVMKDYGVGNLRILYYDYTNAYPSFLGCIQFYQFRQRAVLPVEHDANA